MGIKDIFIITFFIGFAVYLLYRSFKKKNLCSSCSVCSCKI